MPPEEQSTSRLEEIRAGRIAKVAKLRELGIDPYPTPPTYKARRMIADVLSQEPGTAENPIGPFQIAGRIVGRRGHGAITFLDLRDESGQIQILLRREALGDQAEVLDLLDIGDFIELQGYFLITSRTGEPTLTEKAPPTQEASLVPGLLRLLAKALRPLPEKWHGLTDPEIIVRKRHLAMIADATNADVLRKRAEFVRRMRAFLDGEGFIEVATPVLESIPGGADAEPFITHHNALDTDFYLRISLELAHKRLIVGGLERVYEIGRVFRNEGLGREHLQDYDLLEFYWAYADLEALKRLVERFYCSIIEGTFGTLKITYGDDELDFTPPWPEADYFELFRGIDIDLHEYPTAEALLPKAQELGIKEAGSGMGRGRLIDVIYKRKIRPALIRPQFLVGHPVDISPLAKRDSEDSSRVQRLQVLMAGSEVGNGFAELNDPLDQRARFEEQQRLREAGDKEAQRLDEEFLEALEYGMPPTAGFGVSIERFFMYLTNSPTIRDVVAFPLTRPLS